MNTTIGTYGLDVQPPVSRLMLRFSRVDVVSNWRKCHSMATFLADFISEDLEAAEASFLLSDIINELVENAVKYSQPGPTPVRLRLPFWGDRMTIETEHACTLEQAERCAAWVARLDDSDPEALFLEQVEFTARHEPGSSGLGLISLVKDHGAKVGVRISTDEEATRVDLQVHLPLAHLC